MKNIMVGFRAINRDTFYAIRDGLKTVETRAGSKRYTNVAAGDVLVCVCGEERFEREIKKVACFQSIKEMLADVPLKKIMPGLSTIKEAEAAYYSYPGYKEKIAKFGLVAFFLE